VGASYKIMPNLSIAGGYSQSSFHEPTNTDVDDMQSYVVGVDWNPVDNLVVRVNYRHQELGVEDFEMDVDEFRVRVRRTF